MTITHEHRRDKEVQVYPSRNTERAQMGTSTKESERTEWLQWSVAARRQPSSPVYDKRGVYSLAGPCLFPVLL